jgi:hypothetical protein
LDSNYHAITWLETVRGISGYLLGNRESLRLALGLHLANCATPSTNHKDSPRADEFSNVKQEFNYESSSVWLTQDAQFVSVLGYFFLDKLLISQRPIIGTQRHTAAYRHF